MNYPYDIFTAVRQKTFSIESHLVADMNESPMKIYDDSFSRFVFSIINKDAPAGKKVSSFNMKPEELPKLLAITAEAMKEQIKVSYKTGESDEGSSVSLRPALSHKLQLGKLKGKTPAEVLAENFSKGSETLQKQYTFLRDHLSEHPENKADLEAILDASKMSKEMSADEIVDMVKNASQQSASSSTFQIFSLPARPLVRKTNESGLTFCYEGYISWDTSKNYPVSVTISNYYAPVVKKENGMLNVLSSQKDPSSEVKGVFNLTDTEWLSAVSAMEDNLKNFKTINFKLAYQTAEDAGKAIRSSQ